LSYKWLCNKTSIKSFNDQRRSRTIRDCSLW